MKFKTISTGDHTWKEHFTNIGVVVFLVACLILLLGLGVLNPSLRPVSTFFSKLKFDRQRSGDGSRKWTSLPNKKIAVVQFTSAERIEEFVKSWPNHEDRLLRNTQNATLLLACPHTDFEIIKSDIVDALQWNFVEEFDHPHSFANGPLLHYKTLVNTDILLQPMNLHLPRHYLSQPPKTPTCYNGRSWSLAYALYSGAVFSYHILHLPVLGKFDYFLKVDTDIDFLKDMPFDIGEKLDTEGCLVAHSKLETSDDCENDALKAVLQATDVLHLKPPESKGYGWCNENLADLKPSTIFYGNFVAFSTHNLLLHPHIQRISRYLYEEYPDGYYVHRWGDQAPFIMYVCYLLDIPDIHNDEKVCDLTFLRDDVFQHT